MLSEASTKARKRAKIRNRYNQAPYLTLDTNGKVTTSHLNVINITNKSQEVNPFPAGDIHNVQVFEITNNKFRNSSRTRSVHEMSLK